MIDALFGISQAASGWVNKDPSDDYWYMPRGSDTVAGAEIDEDTALTITTVFACVAKIAKSLASLPIDVSEKTGPRTRRPVDHPLEELLSGSANEESDGMTLRQAIQANLELWGNAYVVVDWDGRMREPRQLTLLPSRDIEVKRDRETNKLIYLYHGGSATESIPLDRMWHIPGLSLNGITGVSTISYNRESLGGALAASQFSSAFFGNGAWAGGFISRPLEAPPLSQTAAQQWLDSLNEKFRGAKRAFGFALLREGMEFKQIEMPLEDAMLLGTRKFQRVEICGMFDMPLIMIQDDEHSTYRNSEQADIAFVKHCLLHRAVRLEQAARRRFFSNTRLYLKHNLSGLVRGDFKTRMEGYALGRQWGLFSINDCRAMEDLDPVEGGDTRLEPLNMWPIGQQRPQPVGTIPGDDNDADRSAGQAPKLLPSAQAAAANPIAAILPMARHAAERIVTRQCKATAAAYKRHAAKPDAKAFAEWAETFFSGQREAIANEVQPILDGWIAAGGSPLRGTAGELAQRISERSRRELADLAAYAPEGVPEQIDNWRRDLATEIIRRIADLCTPPASPTILTETPSNNMENYDAN